jgi:hypothetical protein
MNDRYMNDDFTNPDTLEGGCMELESELEAVNRLENEARKEYKAECKTRKVDYKFYKPKKI